MPVSTEIDLADRDLTADKIADHIGPESRLADIRIVFHEAVHEMISIRIQTVEPDRAMILPVTGRLIVRLRRNRIPVVPKMPPRLKTIQADILQIGSGSDL